SSRLSLWVVSTALSCKASRRACAIAFASRKSRMTAPLHRRTERSVPALPTRSPMARGGENLIRSPSQKGRRRRVYRPDRKLGAGPAPVSTGEDFLFAASGFAGRTEEASAVKARAERVSAKSRK